MPVGLRSTDHTPCHTGLRGAAWTCGCLDSGSHFHAKSAFSKHRQAARIPGHCWPQYVANEPITGPSIVPTFVPPPRPCTIRQKNNSHIAFAKPKTKNAAVDAERLIKRVGRRP